jgi:hypothetical protein
MSSVNFACVMEFFSGFSVFSCSDRVLQVEGLSRKDWDLESLWIIIKGSYLNRVLMKIMENKFLMYFTTKFPVKIEGKF